MQALPLAVTRAGMGWQKSSTGLDCQQLLYSSKSWGRNNTFPIHIGTGVGTTSAVKPFLADEPCRVMPLSGNTVSETTMPSGKAEISY